MALNAAASAQIGLPHGRSDRQAANRRSPVAYVYVANTPRGSKTNQILAYSAAPNGVLSRVPGSPFPDNVNLMAVNGKYLMGADAAVADIDAYLIRSTGALTYTTSTN